MSGRGTELDVCAGAAGAAPALFEPDAAVKPEVAVTRPEGRQRKADTLVSRRRVLVRVS